MHDDDLGQRNELRRLPVLHRAPPKGSWVLWHGPQAQAVLDLATKSGEPVSQADLHSLPQVPSYYPPPTDPPQGCWIIPSEDQRYLVRAENHDQYLSCYVLTLP